MVASMSLLAQRGPYGPMDGHMWWGWGWLAGLLFMVLFLALAVVAVWAVVRAVRPPGPPPPPSAEQRASRARAILDERYAQGELSTEEYRERLRVVSEPGEHG